jgi:ankyrin repeat protein
VDDELDRTQTTGAGDSPSSDKPSTGKQSPVDRDQSPTPSTDAPPSPRATRNQYLQAILLRLQDPERREKMLTQACMQGDDEVMQAVLLRCTRGGRQLPNEILFDSAGNSLMHIATKHGQLAIVHQLHDLGCVEADIPNAQNATPLIIAARAGHSDVVAYLLDRRASVEHKDRRENTAFLAASFSSSLSLEVLEMLFNAGSDIDVADERGVGAIHAATIQKNSAMVDWLLTRDATVDLTTAQQTTPLMMAARGGQMDLVDRFLQAGADPLKTDPHGMTALHMAAHEGSAEAVRKLLAYGEKLENETLGPADRLCTGGRNALFLAVFGESPEALC